jgi:anti-sigma regulatory factor (Ser/Thr protein kinase)
MAPSTAGTATARVMLTGTAILGHLTVAGREQNASQARSFVGHILGKDHPGADVARLLVSELFTNAVQHSESRQPGGTVSIIVTGRAGSIGVEVIDQGSMWSVPVVKADIFATSGRGLFLVQSLADEWGYLRDSTGTTVWFRVATGSQRLQAPAAASMPAQMSATSSSRAGYGGIV